MNEADAIAIIQDGLKTALIVSAPVLGVALAVGLLIAFLQALTQIQEITLTFVPKIIAILVTTLFVLPFMHMTLADYAERAFDLITAPPIP